MQNLVSVRNYFDICSKITAFTVRGVPLEMEESTYSQPIARGERRMAIVRQEFLGGVEQVEYMRYKI